MQIGTVIRKYRKEKNMTQEEMASYLGVTAPAVNKWENGNACPDIMLLALIKKEVAPREKLAYAVGVKRLKTAEPIHDVNH